MASNSVRIFAIAWSTVLIVLTGLGSWSPARIGALTWGPTTDFWAISIAISNMEHGLKGKLGYREVAQTLADHLTKRKSDIQVHDEETLHLVQQPDLVTRAIREAAKLKKEDLQPANKYAGGYKTTLAEDVGYADFYQLAFRLFGYDAMSTHYLYMTVLTLGFIVFVITYWQQNVPIGIVSLSITALFLITTSSLLGIPTLPSIAANRFLSTLAIIPFLHIMLAIFAKNPIRRKEGYALMLQAVLLIFATLFRSSAQWAFLTIMVFSLIIALFRVPAPRSKQIVRIVAEWWRSILSRWYGNSPGSTRSVGMRRFNLLVVEYTRLPRPIMVATLVVTVFISVNLIQRLQTDSIYFSDDLLPRHLVWHSAFIGLSYHPAWQQHLPMQELKGLGGDAIPFTLSHTILTNKGIPSIGGAAGNLTRMRLHDRTVRSAYIDFILANPKYVAELFLYYKPRMLITELRQALGTIPIPALTLAVVSIAVSAALFIGKLEIGILSGIAATYLGSLLPVFWAYPVIFVMTDQMWSNLFLGLFLISVGIATTLRLRSYTLNKCK